ncbi:electron transport complex subunit RsxG [Thiofilum flexile]|uniref:electron transport complex subunit RsxG n=1 Tax=Thiofilum flexile TaxID=125627 RepID=UPI00037F56DC|nr:electron transport complex subunit RsxG [Thiofilum flexile]
MKLPNLVLPVWLQHSALAQSTVFLTGFALIGVITLALANHLTKERIAENEQHTLLQRFSTIIDPALYNNPLLSDRIMVPAPELGSADPVIIYRARHDQTPVAALFVVTAPDGYSGRIQLAIGVDAKQNLLGVRVLKHKETPGLGDKIEVERSNWILGFNQKSLSNPTLEHWKVRKDGGDFDQFTGATITPRAIVGSVRRVLEWSSTHFEELFKRPSEPITGKHS